MRILVILLFISATVFSQVNSSKVTWKSRVEVSTILGTTSINKFIYADVYRVTGSNFVQVIDARIPVLAENVQRRSYNTQTTGFLEAINDSVFYRGVPSPGGDFYFNTYRVNNGLIVSAPSEQVGSFGSFIQIAKAPGSDYLLGVRGDNSIHIFDVSDPFTPNVVHISNDAETIGFGNNYLYAGIASELRVLEMRLDSTQSLHLKNQLTVGNTIRSIASADTLLFLALGSSGVACYNIADPENPILLSSFDTPDFAQDIAVNDIQSTIYVADGSSLQMLDFTDPGDLNQAGYHMGIAAEEVNNEGNLIYIKEESQVSIVKSNIGESGSLTFAEPDFRLIGIEGGGNVQRSAKLHNNGDTAITINSLSSTVPEIIVDTFPFSIAPGEEKLISLTFQNPGSIASFSGLLLVNHTGSLSPDTLVIAANVTQDYLNFTHDPIPSTQLGDSSVFDTRIRNGGANPFNLIIDSVFAQSLSFRSEPIVDVELSTGETLTTPMIFAPIHPGNNGIRVTFYYHGFSKFRIFSGQGFGPFVDFPIDSITIMENQIGSTTTDTIYLNNTGDQQFNIVNLNPPEAPFNVSFDTLSATPGDSILLSIEFTPTQPGSFSDSLIIEHNAFESPTTIYLSGLSGLTGTGDEEVNIITEFKLHQNYPNPFNPETRIDFDLPQRSSVELVVYDLLGRKVRTLKSGTLPTGSHQAVWNGKDDAGQTQVSGVYVYQLKYETEAGKRGSLSGKMVLLK